MDPNDFEEIKRLCALKTADMADKYSCQEIIRKYINPGGSWCMTCDPAIRQMFKVLKEWAEANGIIKTI